MGEYMKRSEYISREAAINKIMENIVHQDSHDVNLHNIGLRKAMSAIDSLPAADVAEVVRCGECKHYNAGFECLIEGYGIERPADYFCADGKRKDGGKEK